MNRTSIAARIIAPSVALALACGAALFACGGGGSSNGSTPDGQDGAPPGCAQGQEMGSDGKCAVVLPDGPCPIGKRAAIGSRDCVDVGWTSCPAGFVPHSSGWGCVAVLPSAACAGATMEQLGDTSCHPVGDCNAAFPPPGATYFVNATFTDPQLDATHFRTIGGALGAAPDGATVAVESGTYAENLQPTRSAKLIGRCAEKVVLSGGTAPLPGITLFNPFTLQGFTVSGYVNGIDVEQGGDLTMNAVIVDGNHTTGVEAFDGSHVAMNGSVVRKTQEPSGGGQTTAVLAAANAKIDLVGSVLSGNVDGGLGTIDKASRITMDHSIVRDTVARADRSGGLGAKAFDGSQLDFKTSALSGNRGMALLLSGKDVKGSLEHVAIQDTKVDDRNEGGLAWAISVLKSAELTMTESSIVNNPVVGLSVGNAGSHADVSNSTLTSMQGTGFLGIGTAVYAQTAGSITLTSTAIYQGVGVAVSADGAGSLVTLQDSLVTGTMPISTAAGGVTAGTGGTALGVSRGAKGTVTGTTIQNNAETACDAFSAGSELDLERVFVDGAATNARGQYGHGILAKDGAKMNVHGSVIGKSAAAGVVFAASTGTLAESFVRDNTIGIHVQGGSTLQELDALPDSVDNLEVAVTKDTLFTGNATKVGSGEIPLPGDPITPPSN